MKIFDRLKGQEIEEVVYGDFFVKLAYGGGIGQALVSAPFNQKLLSQLIGYYQSTKLSRGRIAEFIHKYNIKMSDFEVPEGGYISFNDFFIRKLSAGARSFPHEAQSFGAPAEGRLSVFEIENSMSVLSVKGQKMSIQTLLGSSEESQKFVNGFAMVFRLCPVDYHRFHFPDSGIPSESHRLGKTLHSVNPLAQIMIPDVFLTNERQVSYLQSDNFGRLGIIEVGALGVGKIHQTYSPGVKAQRGSEKGYFSFGGSTVILLSQQGALKIDSDLIERSRFGVESLVRLGEVIGKT